MIFFYPIIKRNLKQRNQEQFKRKQEQEETEFPEIFRKELEHEDNHKRDSQTTASTRTVRESWNTDKTVGLRRVCEVRQEGNELLLRDIPREVSKVLRDINGRVGRESDGFTL